MEYQGMYNTTIWIRDENYTKIYGYTFLGNNKIMLIKPNGEPEKDCQEEGKNLHIRTI